MRLLNLFNSAHATEAARHRMCDECIVAKYLVLLNPLRVSLPAVIDRLELHGWAREESNR